VATDPQPARNDSVAASPADADLAWPSRDEWAETLGAAYDLALDYVASVPDSPVSQHMSPAEMAPRFADPLPAFGCTPESALRDWYERARPGIVQTSGPRYFGFVNGGGTPAALAADWLASAIDQNAATWLMSPAAAQTEETAIRWLLELFDLPGSWSGALTSGATTANLSGLAAARQWASSQLGFDAARDGLGGQPVIPVIGSTEVHQSAAKALAILGLGRGAVRTISANDGVIDLEQLDRALADCSGPAIVIANAGEVNTGAFDPVRAMAERCAAHPGGAWLHVDGAFGLYAALSPTHRHLLDGIELANSVASDAHKWLNVPYDCGVVFVRDAAYSRGAFGGNAAYLRFAGDALPWSAIEFVPEMSRRFRALSVWCALRAGGRAGYEAIVQRSLANAANFGDWVTRQPSLELLAPVHLNVVCFRYRGNGETGERLDAMNDAAIEVIQRSGVAYVSGTRWQGAAAIRAAFDNWSTSDADVAALQHIVAGVAQRLTATDLEPETV
jgi:glutamate/tyrosine decarboxylase-like PLP-dependent enzyme